MPSIRLSGLRITVQDRPRWSRCLLRDLRYTQMDAGVRRYMRLGMRLLQSAAADLASRPLSACLASRPGELVRVATQLHPEIARHDRDWAADRALDQQAAREQFFIRVGPTHLTRIVNPRGWQSSLGGKTDAVDGDGSDRSAARVRSSLTSPAIISPVLTRRSPSSSTVPRLHYSVPPPGRGVATPPPLCSSRWL